ncbi:YafY family protein [Pseudoclostridium thermosuccinogenes]|uniref:helix-turn-helix transcriptional regulator n=1 Tax=Clostridium thermosuccinogenes TaxID=84032 RepID=UPI002FDAF9D7
MRIDRLIGITMYLLNRNVVSARELADKFEVSVRTIVRDVEALNMAGIPISSSTGAKGGYEILDTFKLNKQITNMDDYLFIIAALKGMCSAYDNKKIESTLEKLLAVSGCKNDNQRIFLDFGVAKEGENIPEYVHMLENAISEEYMVEFDYTDSENRTNHRIIEPLALTYKWYAWYLFGYCTYKKDYRFFKLNRINNLIITKASFEHKHTSIAELLEAQWSNDRRTYWNIKLLCKAEVKVPVMEYLKGRVLEEHETGDFIISLHYPENERMWFSLLLGFGDKVKVLEPQELKDRLLQKANEIQNLYKN